MHLNPQRIIAASLHNIFDKLEYLIFLFAVPVVRRTSK